MMPSEMMDDLVTWLRAQLDEDERVARAVPGSGCWSKYIEAGDGAAIETDPGGDPGAIIGDEPMAEHMARHDPVRVLAEVAAKRRILDEVVGGLAREERWARRFAEHLARLLALPCADQPGYREEWRP